MLGGTRDGGADSVSATGTKTRKRPSYGYVVTGTRGTARGKIAVGQYLIDYHRFPNEYTWIIFDVKRGEEVGWIDGTYVGRAEYTKAGNLTAATKKQWAARSGGGVQDDT